MAMTGYYSLPGMTAGADLSTKQYHCVRLDTTVRQVVAITNGNAQRPIGILQDDPDASGQPADVAVFGVCKGELGGNVSFGDKLACNNDGELITDVEVTDGSATDLHHIAIALAAGSDGDIIDVYAFPAERIGAE